jgi:SAM-dependent methyltransferase
MFSRSADVYDLLYSFKDYAAEAAAVDGVIRSKAPRASTLLDVACGTGAHLAHFRTQGYRVEGLDLDPALLAVARDRLPRVRLHTGDMRDFALGRRFDAVTCLFSSIGYVRSVRGLRRAVAAMASHLTPGGVLIVEPWFTSDRFTARHFSLLVAETPEVKVARGSFTGKRDRLSTVAFEYLMASAEGLERFREHHVLGLFSHDEMLDAFRRAKLEVEHDPEGPAGRGLYIGIRG